jgi:hypothetical protein
MRLTGISKRLYRDICIMHNWSSMLKDSSVGFNCVIDVHMIRKSQR